METGLWRKPELQKNQRDHKTRGAVRRFSIASPGKMGLKVFDCGSALSIPGQFRRSDVESYKLRRTDEKVGETLLIA